MGKSGDRRAIAAAIKTLEELVGRSVVVNRGLASQDLWPPYHVAKIDFAADPEFRVVVARTFPNGSRQFIRRSIGQVTTERKYAEANAVISAADADELWLILEGEIPI